VRDDHDSSKKTGQVDNFEKKLRKLKSEYGSNLIGIMYFIDPSLSKNRNYYRGRLQEISVQLGIETRICYNGELFTMLNNGSDDWWKLLESTLLQWRDQIPTSVNLNCDLQQDLDEILSINFSCWRKLVNNDGLWNSGVMACLFPTGENLIRARDHFQKKYTESKDVKRKKSQEKYREIAEIIDQQTRTFYTK
jgi:hypothetical protein